MYDLVLRFPLKAKLPVFESVTTDTGVLTYTSATWTLTSNAGAAVSSGSVDNASGTGTDEIDVWKVIDAPTLTLAAGLYILHFETLFTGTSDSIARIQPFDVILVIPGVVTRSI